TSRHHHRHSDVDLLLRCRPDALAGGARMVRHLPEPTVLEPEAAAALRAPGPPHLGQPALHAPAGRPATPSPWSSAVDPVLPSVPVNQVERAGDPQQGCRVPVALGVVADTPSTTGDPGLGANTLRGSLGKDDLLAGQRGLL